MSATVPEVEQAEAELTPEQKEARAKLMRHIETGEEIDSEHVKSIVDDIIARGTNLHDEPPSPTALRLDKWDMRRGKEISETNGKMKAAEIDELEAADFHAAAFHPEPALHPKCTDEMRADYLKQMMETMEYQELHDQTMADDFASELAAAHFGTSYATLRKQKNEIDKKNAERAAKGQPPLSGQAGQPNIIGAIASALGGAQKAVEEYGDACDAMGWGTGPGSNGKIDPSRIAGMMTRINKSQNLKRIIEWAGRWKIVASSCQREKITMGNDEVVGIVPDDVLERILPQEFAYLEEEETEYLFYQKYLEKKTMCREFRAHENLGRGPIVVVVDESGSMSGQRIETAKGMMLTIGRIARKQKRWLTLAAFCGGTQSRIETFPVGNWDEKKMMDWIEAFMGGGTELNVPLRIVPEYLDKLPGCPKGKIDFIVITDDDMHCPEELKQSWLKWKAANKVRLLTIVIGANGGGLAPLSDEIYMVNALTLDCQAAKAAFSI